MPSPISEAAKSAAEQNMDVTFQREIAQYERTVYYEHLVETRNYLRSKIKEFTKGEHENLQGWIVCGSGLASLPRSPDVKVLGKIPTDEIPHWFSPQAEGHGKEVVIANIHGQLVAIQTGRAHIYDTDYSPQQLKMITAPLIVAKGLGINYLITTNAAGVLDNDRVKKGDVVVDVDYVNQQAINQMMGLNDDRLGTRFPSKRDVADPHIFARLERSIPAENLHLGIYNLVSNTPFYEGGADIVSGKYAELIQQNPELVQAYGMSFALDAMTMQRFNNPPKDENGFDRPVRWIGLTAATNVIPNPVAPTKDSLRNAAIPDPNPTNHEEVLAGGILAEKFLIPAIGHICMNLTMKPLPRIK
jgi:purine-nucleoside phosphorylase